MTYRQLFEAIRDHADFLEQGVKDSQVVTLDTEIGDGEEASSDTIVMMYTDLVSELLDNVTGEHGHMVEV